MDEEGLPERSEENAIEDACNALIAGGTLATDVGTAEDATAALLTTAAALLTGAKEDAVALEATGIELPAGAAREPEASRIAQVTAEASLMKAIAMCERYRRVVNWAVG